MVMVEELEKEKPTFELKITLSQVERLRSYSEESHKTADLIDGISAVLRTRALKKNIAIMTNKMNIEGESASELAKSIWDKGQVKLSYSRADGQVYFHSDPNKTDSIDLDSLVDLLHPIEEEESVEAIVKLRRAFEDGKEVLLIN